MENELFNSTIAMKLIAAVKLLRLYGITNPEETKEFDKRLGKLIESENYFITKPFRCCHAEMKTAYHFMQHLRSKLIKDQNENK